mgnify:CR=1 FL=1
MCSFSVDEMFVKINEEESEDEGSDQETNGQLEMESRHSENYGQTESDGQTDNAPVVYHNIQKLCVVEPVT